MKSSEIIKNSVTEVNKQLKKKEKIVFKKDFEILGPKSKLDSLVLVNLFIAVEEKIKSLTGKEINLLSDDFFDYFHLQNSGNGVLDRPEDSEEDNN